MSKIKVLLGTRFNKDGFQSLEKDFELIYPENFRFKQAEAIELLSKEDIEVYVPNFPDRQGQELMDVAKSLRMIANFGVGYDNIDVDYAREKGITVTNTPTSVLEPTAEVAFAHILSAGRLLAYFNNRLHHNERVDWSMFGDLGHQVYGTTLGLFGMGRIGQAVARRACASGMKVIYHTRHRLPAEIESLYDAKHVDFDTLLAQSDYLSLHAPSTPDTNHIINAQTLAKMKNTAILVNTARGALVDTEALASALRDKVIAGAGLDVFEDEPHIPESFVGLDNLVMTPHIGTKTMAYRLDMEREVAKNIANFYNGGVIDKVN